MSKSLIFSRFQFDKFGKTNIKNVFIYRFEILYLLFEALVKIRMLKLI